jgi:hypothetical protein
MYQVSEKGRDRYRARRDEMLTRSSMENVKNRAKKRKLNLKR